MAQSRTVSFRDQTVGGISDFLGDEGLTCAHSQNLLAFLAGELLAYHEEGVLIAPDILFCEDVEGALQSLPGAIYYKIGTKPLNALSAKAILKDCASLAAYRWTIFIERTTDQTLTYGVASFPYVPGSLTLADGVCLSSRNLSIIMQRVSDKTIRLAGSKGSNLTCLFSTSREEETEISAVHNFATKCVVGVADREYCEDFFAYLSTTIDSLLRGSHGCIAACVYDSNF